MRQANILHVSRDLSEHISELPEHIRQYIDITKTGHWRWTAKRHTTKGYAFIRTKDRKRHAVHRIIYKLIIGEPRGSLQIICGAPWCVHPSHMRTTPTMRVGVAGG